MCTVAISSSSGVKGRLLLVSQKVTDEALMSFYTLSVCCAAPWLSWYVASLLGHWSSSVLAAKQELRKRRCQLCKQWNSGGAQEWGVAAVEEWRCHLFTSTKHQTEGTWKKRTGISVLKWRRYDLYCCPPPPPWHKTATMMQGIKRRINQHHWLKEILPFQAHFPASVMWNSITLKLLSLCRARSVGREGDHCCATPKSKHNRLGSSARLNSYVDTVAPWAKG